MLYLLFFLSLPNTVTTNDTSDIVIQLEDEIIEESNRHFFKLKYENLTTEKGASFVRFEVNQKFATAICGLSFFSDSKNYSKLNTPINVDVYNEDHIVISFDDDYDGVYDNRDSIITAEGKRLSSYLLFKHNSDDAKDLKVECQIAIERVDSEYQLYVYYVTKSNGERPCR